MGGVSSPTGRNPSRMALADLKEPLGEVRVLPRDPSPPVHRFVRIDADYAGLEARAMAALCGKCPACGTLVMKMFLAKHCREKDDAVHLALEVLES